MVEFGIENYESLKSKLVRNYFCNIIIELSKNSTLF